MNNRTQQRFDRSIREAVDHVQRIDDEKHATDVARGAALRAAGPPKKRVRESEPKGRLHLCPQTGATVWDPDWREPQRQRSPVTPDTLARAARTDWSGLEAGWVGALSERQAS